MKIIYCHNCGAEVTDASFCYACGEKVRTDDFENTTNTNLQNDSRNEKFIVNSQISGQYGNSQQQYQHVNSNYSANNYRPVHHGSFKIAESADRLIAFIIDIMFIGLIAGIIGGIQGVLTGTFEHRTITEWVKNLFIALPYFWISELSGGTLGKRLLKLRVVDANTYGDITTAQALIHSVGKVYFLIIDVIIGLIVRDKNEENWKNKESTENTESIENDENKEQIRLTQRLANTIVIKYEN